jgi:hypothetical protein
VLDAVCILQMMAGPAGMGLLRLMLCLQYVRLSGLLILVKLTRCHLRMQAGLDSIRKSGWTVVEQWLNRSLVDNTLASCTPCVGWHYDCGDVLARWADGLGRLIVHFH